MFEHATADGLAWACEQAFDRRSDPPAWAALVARGMAVDFDWASGPTAAYLDADRRAIALAAAAPTRARRTPAPRP